MRSLAPSFGPLHSRPPVASIVPPKLPPTMAVCGVLPVPPSFVFQNQRAVSEVIPQSVETSVRWPIGFSPIAVPQAV
jgi:hypothetical protein